MNSIRSRHLKWFSALVTLVCSASQAGLAQAQFAGNTRSSKPAPISDSLNDGAMLSSVGRSASGSRDTQQGSPQTRSLQIVLREGTLIGPLRGRFVVRGQRWSFLPTTAATQSEAGKSQWVDDGLAREVLPDQNSMLGRQRRPKTATLENPPDTIGLGAPSAGVARSESVAPTFESMLVIENLMLDRIARAIEEDPQDDYWVITATVTEFQDENRLMVLTANRARRSLD